MTATEIKLFDMVALTRDLPKERLPKGLVGTVVECYPGGGFEVEFADKNGRTYALVTLKADDLLVLHYEPAMVTIDK